MIVFTNGRKMLEKYDSNVNRFSLVITFSIHIIYKWNIISKLCWPFNKIGIFIEPTDDLLCISRTRYTLVLGKQVGSYRQH